VLVDVVQEAPALGRGVGAIALLGERHLLFFDRPHEPLGVPILARLPLRGHADLRAALLQARPIGGRRVVHAVVRVLAARLVSRQERPLQGAEWEGLSQLPRECPAAHRAGGDSHAQRQGNEIAPQAHVGAVNGLLTNASFASRGLFDCT
jgi:hypothetical protein